MRDDRSGEPGLRHRNRKGDGEQDGVEADRVDDERKNAAYPELVRTALAKPLPKLST
jgi:hypothetical protein